MRVEGEDITVLPSGQVARVSMNESDAGEAQTGLPCIRRSAGDVHIPCPPATDAGDGQEPITPYWIIVSSMVLEAAIAASHPLLKRLVAPDTGATAVRESGQIVAVTRLVIA